MGWSIIENSTLYISEDVNRLQEPRTGAIEAVGSVSLFSLPDRPHGAVNDIIRQCIKYKPNVAANLFIGITQ